MINSLNDLWDRRCFGDNADESPHTVTSSDDDALAAP